MKTQDLYRQLPAWASERQAEVVELVRDTGYAAVDDLARRFGVSPQTIRKDVNAMCERGVLRRVHGGVELAHTNADHYELRRILNIAPKRMIARAAAHIIPNEATVAVSIGTTPELAVSCLSQHKKLKIYTNNLHVAMTAHQFEGARVSIPGGTLRTSEADIVGPSAVDFFDAYRFDFGLFGVAAVDQNGGLLDLFDEDARSREAIFRNAQTRILVLDSSKFDRRAHVRSGHISDVEHVICETRPPEPIRQQLQKARVNLIVCDEAAP